MSSQIKDMEKYQIESTQNIRQTAKKLDIAGRGFITIVDKKTAGIDTYFPIPLSEIEDDFTLTESKSLTDNAQYTYWAKIT